MKIELPTEKKLVHEMGMPVRWGDMDAFGHVNNTVYFRYFESARVAWLASLGSFQRPNGEGVVIVNAFTNFYKQLSYPADIVIKSYVSSVGRSSFDCWYELYQSDDPQTLWADGGCTSVWINIAAQKSAPLPDDLKAILL